MTNAELKREIRTALKRAGEWVSKSSTTAVRGFHSASSGWNISEFAGNVQLNYVRNGMSATTSDDLERAFVILTNSGIGAEIRNDRVVVSA
jgi:hypothetical protein